MWEHHMCNIDVGKQFGVSLIVCIAKLQNMRSRKAASMNGSARTVSGLQAKHVSILNQNFLRNSLIFGAVKVELNGSKNIQRWMLLSCIRLGFQVTVPRFTHIASAKAFQSSVQFLAQDPRADLTTCIPMRLYVDGAEAQRNWFVILVSQNTEHVLWSVNEPMDIPWTYKENKRSRWWRSNFLCVNLLQLCRTKSCSLTAVQALEANHTDSQSRSKQYIWCIALIFLSVRGAVSSMSTIPRQRWGQEFWNFWLGHSTHSVPWLRVYRYMCIHEQICANKIATRFIHTLYYVYLWTLDCYKVKGSTLIEIHGAMCSAKASRAIALRWPGNLSRMDVSFTKAFWKVFNVTKTLSDWFSVCKQVLPARNFVSIVQQCNTSPTSCPLAVTTARTTCTPSLAPKAIPRYLASPWQYTW